MNISGNETKNLILLQKGLLDSDEDLSLIWDETRDLYSSHPSLVAAKVVADPTKGVIEVTAKDAGIIGLTREHFPQTV